QLRHLFEAVGRGEIAPAEAALRGRTAPLEEAGGVAVVDLHRRLRCGVPGVIFGQGKHPEQVVAVLRPLLRHGEGGLVTPVGEETAVALQRAFSEGEYTAPGRTFRVRGGDASRETLGKVVVATAGTSDLPVAEEARVTAEAWGCEVALVADVG